MQLKATQFMLPLLRLSDNDVDAIAEFVSEKVSQAPALLDGAPVVIDLEALPADNRALDFASVVGTLRACGMVPVGIRGADDEHRAMAGAFDLAVLPKAAPARKRPSNGATTAPTAEKDKNSAAATMLVDKPIRSGQRLYAKGADMIVTGNVSAGSEILADGHIHVYGSLRGRAMAGVTGKPDARIFCQGLNAELVSIAGVYRVNEDLDPKVRNSAVTIRLDGSRLIFSAL